MSFKEHTKGEIAKNYIINYLLSRDYEVLQEGTSQGLIDLVGVNPETGQVYFIDCKSLSRRVDGTRVNRILKPAQKDLQDKVGIPFIIAYADSETGSVEIPKLGV